jgi:PAS domain S-box-containing protein
MIVGDRLVGTLAIADSAPRSWGRAVEVARAVAERVWYSHRSAVLLAGLKASESRLRDSEAQLRRVLDQLFVFVAVVTPQGVLLDTNQAPLSAGDLSHEDVAGRRFTETYWWLHDRAAAARVEGAIKRAAAGDTIRFDIDVQLAQGRRETVDFQIGPLRDRQGAITHLIASLVPIGDRVRAEAELRRLKEELEDLVEKRTASLMHANLRLTEEMEQRVTAQNALAQAQKLEALGHLTAGIAHDFNNAIAAIGSGFNLIRKWSTDPRVVTIANHGDEAAARSAGLVKQLLAFARQQPLRPTRICIYDALMAAEPLIRRSVGPGVQLDLQCPEDIGACTVDPVSLETALINLSVNARDAMPMGGALRIGARRLEAGDPALPAELKARAGMAIAIADEGLGMSAEVLQRAIEPFFTTKGPGKGTGLGLAMAHGFVHQSGGAMRIESEPGAGAVVTIFLPATDAGPECACPENHASPRPLPPIDLLVVDDDNAVRAIIAAHLRDMGLTVEDATTADEARTLISARRFDAVLCDVVMPGENGLEVARSLREIQPGVPILFMTGHADRTLLVDEAVIDKPFAMEDLIAALSAVMARVPA